MHLIFVHGKLRRSFQNHHLLCRALCLGGGRTRMDVAGELYKVDDSTLLVLDALEGHPHDQRRCLTAVTLDDGREFIAWLYQPVDDDTA